MPALLSVIYNHDNLEADHPLVACRAGGNQHATDLLLVCELRQTAVVRLLQRQRVFAV